MPTPGPQGDVQDYWGRVVVKAAIDTRQAVVDVAGQVVGINIGKGFAYSAIVLAIILALRWVYEGREAALGTITALKWPAIGTLIGAGLLFLWELAHAPMRLENEVREAREVARARIAELEALRRPKLHVFFDPESKSCVHPMPWVSDAPGLRRGVFFGGVLFRIGISNASDVEVTDATVRLTGSVPGATGLPAAMHKMHDLSRPPRTHFNIAPHAPEFFDILIVPHKLNPDLVDELRSPAHHMCLAFADPVMPWIPTQSCVLRFSVEAANANPIEHSLAIEVEFDGWALKSVKVRFDCGAALAVQVFA